MKKIQSYFHEASHWADERFGLIEASRNRYQAAFLSSLAVSVSLALAIVIMMPLKSVETVAIHHYENGVTTVEAPDLKTMPVNKAQVESDIVRYVINRESYDISSYQPQYELIALLSSDEVFKSYEKTESSSNPDAPINILGTKFNRSVHVYSINFIDKEGLNDTEVKRKQTHHNLAEVVFSVKDHDKSANRDKENHFTALISWRYNNPPASIEARWRNFDGFEVTRYSLAQRNI